MINTVFIWTIIALMFLILEIGHPGLLFFLSFCGGALSATILAWLDVSLAWQLISFFGCTLATFLFLKLFLKKFHRAIHKTNVYALIGRQGMVTQEINSDQYGYVKIDGELWRARSTSHSPLPMNTEILVIDARGAHLVVEKRINTIL